MAIRETSLPNTKTVATTSVVVVTASTDGPRLGKEPSADMLYTIGAALPPLRNSVPPWAGASSRCPSRLTQERSIVDWPLGTIL
jgi:hypothetical protein